MKKILLNFSLVFIPIAFFITLFAILLRARIITIPGFIVNTVNNISMEKTNPKYGIDNYSIVELGDVATSDGFDFQVISSEEKNEIKTNNNLYKPKDSNHRFIILKSKIRNSTSNIYEPYIGDFVLRNLNSKREYGTTGTGYKIISDIYDQKTIKKFAFFNKINPGVIKYQYLIFSIPKEEKMDEFILRYYHTYFKII